ncbi:SpoIIE family protein phosphatase [Desulfopila sp. IMCC35008]|uniref:SpoIIE family protein phosphatase n=1 Tax=Desulfopila sp. IMCC35008 TaxID=2653858 RepID=UPI0013D166EF|nr:SpoIIE family protein phosphatase [Desulfopila sp. IMCC35008]
MNLRGIAFRLAALTLLFSALIFAGIVGYNYTVSRDIIVGLAEERGTLLADSTAKRISASLNSVQKVVESISFSLEDSNISRDLLGRLGRRVLSDNSEIFGTAVAFEPFGFDSDREYYTSYSYRSQNRFAHTILGGLDYQYFYMDWYQLAKEFEQPIWTEPYYDEGGGNQLMATYSVPFYRKQKGRQVLRGVVTADISITRIQTLISEINANESGYVFMLSRYGTFIAHPNSELVMNETIFTSAESLEHPLLTRVGRRMIGGETGVEEVPDLPFTGDSFVYFTPLPDQQWSIGVVFPKKEMLAEVGRLNREVAALGAFGFLALALLITYITTKITSPLRNLTMSANHMASGDLDTRLPEVVSHDEVGELTAAFRTMQDSLKSYITDLTRTTAVKERIESELRIAHEIQMSILPKLFPAFPERSEFDIYAFIDSAREVGGDLYDFFFVDEDRFYFLVGDVSGKGVPAAFFMAVTKTLLKVVAERGLDPGEVLTKVNKDLAEDNESCMFVTLFLAVIDVNTGEVRYANAGHNPPLIVPKGEPAQWVSSENELMAGVMDDTHYTTRVMTMRPGDTLFIYTDGVTEAMNNDDELYAEERLVKVMNECGGRSAQEIVRSVEMSLKEFTGGAAQSDDITMLTMQYIGKKNQ